LTPDMSFSARSTRASLCSTTMRQSGE
jgi:hypothetical protein